MDKEGDGEQWRGCLTCSLTAGTGKEEVRVLLLSSMRFGLVPTQKLQLFLFLLYCLFDQNLNTLFPGTLGFCAQSLKLPAAVWLTPGPAQMASSPSLLNFPPLGSC